MKVLVACEYSAVVRDAFRRGGHDAWSCDLLSTEGDPQWHIQQPVETVLDQGWDLMVAFPPCTDLAVSGSRWWPQKQADGRQRKAAEFFIHLFEASIPRVAVENPSGWMNSNWRKPDQIIHPWMFGDPWAKQTCLWLKGLPALEWTSPVTPQGHWVGGDARKPGRHRNPKERSRTFKGVASAMASQWAS